MRTIEGGEFLHPVSSSPDTNQMGEMQRSKRIVFNSCGPRNPFDWGLFEQQILIERGYDIEFRNMLDDEGNIVPTHWLTVASISTRVKKDRIRHELFSDGLSCVVWDACEPRPYTLVGLLHSDPSLFKMMHVSVGLSGISIEDIERCFLTAYERSRERERGRLRILYRGNLTSQRQQKRDYERLKAEGKVSATEDEIKGLLSKSIDKILERHSELLPEAVLPDEERLEKDWFEGTIRWK